MEITNLGLSSFKFVGKTITVVSDPFDSTAVGVAFPKVDADVVTVSHQEKEHNNTAAVRGNFICFDSPGEYEIKDTEIIGVESLRDKEKNLKNTIFVYKIDEMHVCHLGDLAVELSTEQIEKIDGVDILLVPVGGTGTIGSKDALKIISAVEPKIVIPMHYKIGKLTDLEPVEAFLKEIGKDSKTLDKLKVNKKDLPDEMEVVVLKA